MLNNEWFRKLNKEPKTTEIEIQRVLKKIENEVLRQVYSHLDLSVSRPVKFYDAAKMAMLTNYQLDNETLAELDTTQLNILLRLYHL